jgi:hypothetical protein
MRTVIAVVMLCGFASTLASQTPRIEDNSFLVEEAYNQERGVVQHITTWQRSLRAEAWDFSFTQEWPFLSQSHQLSYTFLLGSTRDGTEFGGLGLNYRYQLLPTDARVTIAPRLSALLPARREHVGVQFAVPVSVRLTDALVGHLNGGVTETTRVTTLYNVGGSLVWLARPTFNVLCELVWAEEEGSSALLLNPGIRWAHNFPSGLQIVPGMAFTYGLGPSKGVRAAFLYLSFEHPFGGGSEQQ